MVLVGIHGAGVDRIDQTRLREAGSTAACSVNSVNSGTWLPTNSGTWLPDSLFRVDVIGSASLHATTLRYHDNAEDVRLPCAQRASSLEQAELLLWEVEFLLCCGYRGSITPSVITYSASMAREKVTPRTEILVA